jgi:hypothetical protein
VWSGVRNTFDGFFSGDTRTDEEVWEDFRESTQSDPRDEETEDDDKDDTATTTTRFDTQTAIDELVAERRRDRNEGGLFSQFSAPTVPDNESITTELAVVDIDQTGQTEQLKIAVTHRDSSGEIVEQTVETVGPTTPLVVFDPKTDEATVYEIIERDTDGTTYLSEFRSRAVEVVKPAPTLAAPPQPTAQSRNFIRNADSAVTTELAVVDSDPFSTVDAVKVAVTQRDETGAVLRASEETVSAAAPLVIVDPKTNVTTVYELIERDRDGTIFLAEPTAREVVVVTPSSAFVAQTTRTETSSRTTQPPLNAENVTTRRVATELRVVSVPEARFIESQPTVLEVTTRAETGTILNRENVSVELAEPLYITNQETGVEEIYTLAVGNNQAVTLMPLNNTAPVPLRTNQATVVGSANDAFLTREQTTELQLLNVTEQAGVTRALLEITQRRDDGEIMDRAVRDVRVDSPIEVTNAETGEISTFTPRRIDRSGTVTLTANDTGTSYTITPERNAAVTTRYEVPFTSQQTRQRVAYEPSVRVQTENQRLRDGVTGVRQYQGDGLENLNEQERNGLFNRIMGFFANFLGVGSTEAPEQITPGTTDPYFPATSSS